MKNDPRAKIFTGGGHPELVKEICQHLEVQEGQIFHSVFADGEIYCRIEESVRGCDTFVISPTCPPVNESLMRTLIVIDCLRRASAASVTAVVPYFGYSRMEKKSLGREPITAKLVANLFTTAGANRLVTMDMHDPALQGFFDIPVDHLSAGKILAGYFHNHDLKDFIVVAPDTGGVFRAREFANRLKLPLAIIDKRRPEPNRAVVMNVIGEVKGKNAIVLDDIIDTAGTVVEVSEILFSRGVKKVVVCCSHALLSPPATTRIASSRISEMITTNSIPLNQKQKELNTLHVLSVASLIGDAIFRIHHKISMSELFI